MANSRKAIISHCPPAAHQNRVSACSLGFVNKPKISTGFVGFHSLFPDPLFPVPFAKVR
ncbi:hypothetical protein [Moorena sp. SIO3H5]|uniref:hypothetical protein n=1 Tax=Moorena sp. SIO3H5 TaxID=2607834 RepID=UPI0013B904D6|nr:hypothetical protein [Moorena sp. SIO3H5]NEO69933.1 hypothetical protein [Moorena sp. SIO3H5]